MPLTPSEFRYVYGLDDDLDDQGHKSISERNQSLVRRVYRYSDDRYLVTFLPPSAPKDFVDSSVDAPDEWFPWKRRNNIVRAQSAIQALGFCNDWDYFITCTLDPNKFPDRLALDLFREKVTHLFRRIRSESGSECRFLLVPELHKNQQGWHMHGLLAGFPDSCFRKFELSEKLPAYLLLKIAKGEKIYDFPRYRDIFGFCDVEPLRSRDHAVSYLCKYVVKGLQSTGLHIDKGKHLYFSSKGLNRPQLVDESDQFSSSSVLDALELDGFRPSFDADIKFEVNGVEQKLGYKVWYEFSPGQAPSELSSSFSRSYSMHSLLALHDSESESGSNCWG